jgi:hypothetical protein
LAFCGQCRGKYEIPLCCEHIKDKVQSRCPECNEKQRKDQNKSAGDKSAAKPPKQRLPRGAQKLGRIRALMAGKRTSTLARPIMTGKKAVEKGEGDDDVIAEEDDEDLDDDTAEVSDLTDSDSDEPPALEPLPPATKKEVAVKVKPSAKPAEVVDVAAAPVPKLSAREMARAVIAKKREAEEARAAKALAEAAAPVKRATPIEQAAQLKESDLAPPMDTDDAPETIKSNPPPQDQQKISQKEQQYMRSSASRKYKMRKMLAGASARLAPQQGPRRANMSKMDAKSALGALPSREALEKMNPEQINALLEQLMASGAIKAKPGAPPMPTAHPNGEIGIPGAKKTAPLPDLPVVMEEAGCQGGCGHNH